MFNHKPESNPKGTHNKSLEETGAIVEEYYDQDEKYLPPPTDHEAENQPPLSKLLEKENE